MTPRIPQPVSLERCLRLRSNCNAQDAKYWDEMIRISAERESKHVRPIQIRTDWDTAQKYGCVGRRRI